MTTDNKPRTAATAILRDRQAQEAKAVPKNDKEYDPWPEWIGDLVGDLSPPLPLLGDKAIFFEGHSSSSNVDFWNPVDALSLKGAMIDAIICTRIF